MGLLNSHTVLYSASWGENGSGFISDVMLQEDSEGQWYGSVWKMSYWTA